MSTIKKLDVNILSDPNHDLHKLEMHDLIHGMTKSFYKLVNNAGFSCNVEPVYHSYKSEYTGLDCISVRFLFIKDKE